MSNIYTSETPQRKRYVIGELKKIMKENNLKSFRSLKDYLENPETSNETNWSVYLNGNDKKDLNKISSRISKGLTKTEKIKEKLFDSDKWKQTTENKFILEEKKFGYIKNNRKEITIEKVLYRGEFKINARDKKGHFAGFVKK